MQRKRPPNLKVCWDNYQVTKHQNIYLCMKPDSEYNGFIFENLRFTTGMRKATTGNI